MPAMTTGNRSFAFGNFAEGFKWREVRGITVLRLEERYADAFQVAFLGFARMDASVVNTAAFKLGAQA
jgi:HK97 family phage major capsid protein